MSDVEIIGQAVAVETSGAPPRATSHERASTKSELSLLEAATVSGVPVHILKAAIYRGALPATRHGRCVVKRFDLDEWLRENWQHQASISSCD
ncbi:MAG: helix-turn-helix domain-containing protein [Acidobacteriota bacterium]|nr:helix-turn-helix domain-containing protein [Acidobacteriota bacterium]